MIELFAARNVTSVLCKRSDRPAGNTLISAPASIKKFCLVFLSKRRRRQDLPVAWAAFTDWPSSLPMAVETCKVRGISELSRQIARDTNKWQVVRENVVVLALIGAGTAMFSRSSAARFEWQ